MLQLSKDQAWAKQISGPAVSVRPPSQFKVQNGDVELQNGHGVLDTADRRCGHLFRKPAVSRRNMNVRVRSLLPCCESRRKLYLSPTVRDKWVLPCSQDVLIGCNSLEKHIICGGSDLAFHSKTTAVEASLSQRHQTLISRCLGCRFFRLDLHLVSNL